MHEKTFFLNIKYNKYRVKILQNNKQNNKRCEHLLKYSPKQEIILYRSISL